MLSDHRNTSNTRVCSSFVCAAIVTRRKPHGFARITQHHPGVSINVADELGARTTKIPNGHNNFIQCSPSMHYNAPIAIIIPFQSGNSTNPSGAAAHTRLSGCVPKWHTFGSIDWSSKTPPPPHTRAHGQNVCAPAAHMRMRMMRLKRGRANEVNGIEIRVGHQTNRFSRRWRAV